MAAWSSHRRIHEFKGYVVLLVWGDFTPTQDSAKQSGSTSKNHSVRRKDFSGWKMEQYVRAMCNAERWFKGDILTPLRGVLGVQNVEEILKVTDVNLNIEVIHGVIILAWRAIQSVIILAWRAIQSMRGRWGSTFKRRSSQVRLDFRKVFTKVMSADSDRFWLIFRSKSSECSRAIRANLRNALKLRQSLKFKRLARDVLATFRDTCASQDMT